MIRKVKTNEEVASIIKNIFQTYEFYLSTGVKDDVDEFINDPSLENLEILRAALNAAKSDVSSNQVSKYNAISELLKATEYESDSKVFGTFSFDTNGGKEHLSALPLQVARNILNELGSINDQSTAEDLVTAIVTGINPIPDPDIINDLLQIIVLESFTSLEMRDDLIADLEGVSTVEEVVNAIVNNKYFNDESGALSDYFEYYLMQNFGDFSTLSSYMTDALVNVTSETVQPEYCFSVALGLFNFPNNSFFDSLNSTALLDLNWEVKNNFNTNDYTVDESAAFVLNITLNETYFDNTLGEALTIPLTQAIESNSNITALIENINYEFRQLDNVSYPIEPSKNNQHVPGSSLFGSWNSSLSLLYATTVVSGINKAPFNNITNLLSGGLNLEPFAISAASAFLTSSLEYFSASLGDPDVLIDAVIGGNFFESSDEELRGDFEGYITGCLANDTATSSNIIDSISLLDGSASTSDYVTSILSGIQQTGRVYFQSNLEASVNIGAFDFLAANTSLTDRLQLVTGLKGVASSILDGTYIIANSDHLSLDLQNYLNSSGVSYAVVVENILVNLAALSETATYQEFITAIVSGISILPESLITVIDAAHNENIFDIIGAKNSLITALQSVSNVSDLVSAIIDGVHVIDGDGALSEVLTGYFANNYDNYTSIAENIIDRLSTYIVGVDDFKDKLLDGIDSEDSKLIEGISSIAIRNKFDEPLAIDKAKNRLDILYSSEEHTVEDLVNVIFDGTFFYDTSEGQLIKSKLTSYIDNVVLSDIPLADIIGEMKSRFLYGGDQSPYMELVISSINTNYFGNLLSLIEPAIREGSFQQSLANTTLAGDLEGLINGGIVSDGDLIDVIINDEYFHDSSEGLTHKVLLRNYIEENTAADLAVTLTGIIGSNPIHLVSSFDDNSLTGIIGNTPIFTSTISAAIGGGSLPDGISSLSQAVTTALSDASAAQSDATSALSAANAAQSDATSALSAANAAQSDATSALSDATAAQSDATSALSAASAAQSDATSALSAANAAQSDATSALSAASNAQSDATSALSAASNAQSDATTALSAASNAQSDASNALSTANNVSTIVGDGEGLKSVSIYACTSSDDLGELITTSTGSITSIILSMVDCANWATSLDDLYISTDGTACSELLDSGLAYVTCVGLLKE